MSAAQGTIGEMHAAPGPASKRVIVGYGFWIFLLSDIVMFSAFFAGYAVLSNETAGGPSGKDLFHLHIVAIETACLLLSSFTRILLPTISLGKTRSSRIASCTLVRVRLLGRFCLFFVRLFLVGLGRILLCAMNTTCLPLNFFSSSRTSLTWIFWKDFSWGTGTKMMMAFLLPPTSISLAAVMWSSLS